MLEIGISKIAPYARWSTREPTHATNRDPAQLYLFQRARPDFAHLRALKLTADCEMDETDRIFWSDV